jgi:hypothetical protein
VRALRAKALKYLASFYDTTNDRFGLNAPENPGTHITSTIFCLLELDNDQSLREDFGRKAGVGFRKKIAARLLAPDLRVTSAGLPEFNMYTAPIYVAGLAALGNDLADGKAKEALQAVISRVQKNHGSVNWDEGWEASGFLAHWCWRALSGATSVVDAARRGVCVEAKGLLEDWAESEVYRQIALGLAHQSEFDPMELGYSLTMCIAQGEKCPISNDMIRTGIDLIFGRQADDGIWPGSSAIFAHEKRGTIYVFAPEMLAVLLGEARGRREAFQGMHGGILKFIRWVEDNERGSEQGQRGWTSNHLPFEADPESWSTAAVLGTLREVDRLSRAILTDTVVASFSGKLHRDADSTKFDSLLDSDVEGLEVDGNPATSKTVLRKYFIDPWLPSGSKKDGLRSGILFGPSGTAKTTFVSAVAEALGWPLISINMGHFLAQGIPYISAQAEEIFRQLVEADSVVILFDEIEEFVRDRNEKGLERETRMLINNMLTLSEKLYREGRGMFFVGTNHAEQFDAAVTKPGRFDVILKVLPPSKVAKQDYLTKRLEAVGTTDLTQAESFMNDMFANDLRQLTFTDWQRFTEGVVQTVKDGGANLHDALRLVLERFDRREDAKKDLNRYKEPSRIL